MEAMRARHYRKWHLDEVCAKINGPAQYTWRVVDHDREVLENFAPKTHDRKAALKLMKRSMRRPGGPEILVVDRLRSRNTCKLTRDAAPAEWRGLLAV